LSHHKHATGITGRGASRRAPWVASPDSDGLPDNRSLPLLLPLLLPLPCDGVISFPTPIPCDRQENVATTMTPRIEDIAHKGNAASPQRHKDTEGHRDVAPSHRRKREDTKTRSGRKEGIGRRSRLWPPTTATWRWRPRDEHRCSERRHHLQARRASGTPAPPRRCRSPGHSERAEGVFGSGLPRQTHAS